MNIIIANKVKLIEWLRGEDMVLQYVQSRKLVNMNEYTRVKSVRDPSEQIQELLDIIVEKEDSTCFAFLELLKEDDVNESRPELRRWITTVNISAPDREHEAENMNASQAAAAAGAAAGAGAGAVQITDPQEFLRKNRSRIIGRVKTVDEIVDDLQYLTNELAANVRAERTEQAKMRKILEYTNSEKASQLLVDALFAHAADVMEELITA